MITMDCTAPNETTFKSNNNNANSYIEYYHTPGHLGKQITLTFDNKIPGKVKVHGGDKMSKDHSFDQHQPYESFAKKDQESAQHFIISKEIMDLLTKQMQGKDSYVLGEYTLVKTSYFERLKHIDSQIDNAVDQIMYETTLERKDDVADIPLADVMEELDIDINSIMELMDTIEEDC